MELRKARGGGLAALLLAAVCAAGRAAPAQDTKRTDWQAQPLPYQARQQTPNDAAAFLSRRLNRSVLIEDNRTARPPADFDAQGTAKETLDQVAAAFDMEWAVDRRGALTLRKQFRDEAELPQMHLAEMRRMARQIVDALDRVGEAPLPRGWDMHFRTLFDMLTPAQVQKLQSGETLMLPDLTPPQGQFLQRLIIDHRLGDAKREWLRLRDTLDAMPRSQVEIRESPAFHQRVSGMDISSPARIDVVWTGRGPGGEELWLPIKQTPVKEERKGGGKGKRKEPSTARDATARLGPPPLAGGLIGVSAAPAGDDPAPLGLRTPVELDLGPTTAAELAGALARQSGLKIGVADYLRPRRLTAHLRGVTVRQALDTLCELHGWAWREDEPGSLLLDRRNPPLATGLANLSPALRASMPLDFQRFIGVDREFPGLTGPPPDPRTGGTRERNPFQAGNMSGTLLVLAGKQKELFPLLFPDEQDRATLPYERMTKEQQQKLLEYNILAVLHVAVKDDYDQMLFAGKFFPFESDLGQARLTLPGDNFLRIGSERIVGNLLNRVGFAASLNPGGTDTRPRVNVPLLIRPDNPDGVLRDRLPPPPP